MSNENDGMDKFAVDENVDGEQLEKLSAKGCPTCGGKVHQNGRLLFCDNCGTQPFEGAHKK